jgi:signal peptidase
MRADAERGLPHGSGGSRARKPGSRLISWVTTAALALAAAFAAIMLVPAAFGLERYVITGDSMGGTYDRGSVVFSEVVPVSELRVGDTITYEPPAAAGVDGLITHRIIEIDHDRRGQPVLRTKGDANEARDPWRFTLQGTEQARVVAGLPYVGYFFAGLGLREVRIALIGIPALAVAIALLAGLWRDAGDEARRAAAPPLEPSDAGGA